MLTVATLTLVPKGLRSTKGGLSSLTVADSMDHIGVHQLSGRGALSHVGHVHSHLYGFR